MNGVFKIFLFLAAGMVISAGCGALNQFQEKPNAASLPIKPDGKLTPAEHYVVTYRDLAVKEMARTGIPASIKIAQGMLESGCGNSQLSKIARNHFGIKCMGNWDGWRIHMDDDEEKECFRVYESVEASFRDHSDFLKGNPRYQKLFELDIHDYKGWARGLKTAGYASRSDYDRLLIGLIEKYQLHVYDRMSGAGQSDWYDDLRKWIRSRGYVSSGESVSGLPGWCGGGSTPSD